MTRLRLAGGLALAGLPAAGAAPESALAHGLVGKQDLPIPRWLFAWAASLVLVVSFVGLAALWATPRLQRVEERRRFRVPRRLEVLAGAAGVAGFAFVVYDNPKEATRSQYWMLAVMVAFTSLGLWLLSATAQ